MLKWQCHEIFCFLFFSWISFSQDSDYTIRAVSNFSKIRGDISSSNLPPVSLIPVVHLDLRISPRIYEKNSKRAGGKLIHEKNQQQNISWHCPFKAIRVTGALPRPHAVRAAHQKEEKERKVDYKLLKTTHGQLLTDFCHPATNKYIHLLWKRIDKIIISLCYDYFKYVDILKGTASRDFWCLLYGCYPN